MSLSDQNTSMMNTLRQPTLKHSRLQPSLQEIFDFKSQHVIESHASLVEHTDTDQSTDKSITLEKSLGVLSLELEELKGGTTNLGEDEGDTPDLTLVAQAVLAGELFGLGCLNSDHMFLDEETGHTFNSASRRADSKGRRGTL